MAAQCFGSGSVLDDILDPNPIFNGFLDPDPNSMAFWIRIQIRWPSGSEFDFLLDPDTYSTIFWIHIRILYTDLDPKVFKKII